MCFRFNIGSAGIVTSEPINDAQWHDVTISVDNFEVVMTVDDVITSQAIRTATASIADLLKDSSNMYLGGVSAGYFSNSRDLFTNELAFYKGCIDEVRVGGVLLPFFSQSQQGSTGAAEQFSVLTTRNIVIGCVSDPVCQPETCLNAATCVDEWNQFSCQCAAGEIPGLSFVGSFCGG